MLQSFDEVAEVIRKTLLARYPQVKKAYIFGSFARGEQTSQSDVDILIDFKPNQAMGFDFYDIAEDIEHGTGRRVDLLTRTTVRTMPFMGEVEKEAKVVYEA